MCAPSKLKSEPSMSTVSRPVIPDAREVEARELLEAGNATPVKAPIKIIKLKKDTIRCDAPHRLAVWMFSTHMQALFCWKH